KKGAGDRGLLNRSEKAVDESLRRQPFLGEPSARKLFARRHVLDREDLLDLGKHHRRKCRIVFAVFFQKQLAIMGVVGRGQVDAGGTSGSILKHHAAQLAADEFADAVEHDRPQRWIERSIVDVADQGGKALVAQRAAPLRQASINSMEAWRSTLRTLLGGR